MSDLLLAALSVFSFHSLAVISNVAETICNVVVTDSDVAAFIP